MHKPKSKSTSDSRRIAAQAIAKVLSHDAFSNTALSQAIESSQLSSIDKAFCTELVYGTIRWAKPLELSIRRALDKPDQKIDAIIMPHLLVAAYQLQHLSERIPAHAAVNSAVNEIKRIRSYLGGFANAVLRRLGSPLHTTLGKDCQNLELLSQSFGLPLFFVKAISHSLPRDEWQIACAAMNERPRLYFRILSSEKSIFESEAHRFVPNAVSLGKTGSVKELDGFASGDFMVQDPASQIAALLVCAAPSSTVIDCCAAPGSKSIVLKKAVGAKGRVIAIDVSEAKLQHVKENAARMQVEIEIMRGDARALMQDASLLEKADAVLLDAPCSGLGTIRRHPEIKLRRTEDNLAELTSLQSQLLESAARSLKPGGTLVYSVCSPLHAEGTMQIAHFLNNHSNFKREEARTYLPWLPADATNELGEVVLWPHRHDCDAFFAARLRKEYN